LDNLGLFEASSDDENYVHLPAIDAHLPIVKYDDKEERFVEIEEKVDETEFCNVNDLTRKYANDDDVYEE